nr:MAG TPA: hypothetical protein [Bacteriophage sp.]
MIAFPLRACVADLFAVLAPLPITFTGVCPLSRLRGVS